MDSRYCSGKVAAALRSSLEPTHYHLPGALEHPVQVYYAPRQPVYCQATLPTIFGNFRLLRVILIREGITLVHAHQAFSVMGHEAILQARTMGYKVSSLIIIHSCLHEADPSVHLTYNTECLS